MTLVLRRSLAGPGTHALIIGAGIYEDGSATSRQKMIENSAQEMVAWLATRYRNPSAELATIDVYADSWIWCDLDHVPNFTDQHTSRASHQQIEAATENWMRRAGLHEDNIALFYFAGRAFDQDLDTLLAFHDFERPASYGSPATSKSGVASFSSLITTMRGCRAGRQLYLLDVDRNESRNDIRAELLLRPGLERSPQPRQAVIYSAAEGQRSFPQLETELVRPFVPLLTRFLESGAADPSTGAITVNQLAAGLTKAMNEEASRMGVDQRVEFESVADFDFHYPPRPRTGNGLKPDINEARKAASASPAPPEPPKVAHERDATNDRRPNRGVPTIVDRGIVRAWRGWITKHRDKLAVDVMSGLAVVAIAAICAALLGLTD